ncbi:MAG: hypothetical protein U5Q44_07965 [Dehalococcoidia bacterium]|nr:hypothetical protein [Dehalococcoidia bacterium]
MVAQGDNNRTSAACRAAEERAFVLEVDVEKGVRAADEVEALLEACYRRLIAGTVAKPGEGIVPQGLDGAVAVGLAFERCIVEDGHRVVGEEAEVDLDARSTGPDAGVDGLGGVGDVGAIEIGAVRGDRSWAAVPGGLEQRRCVVR